MGIDSHSSFWKKSVSSFCRCVGGWVLRLVGKVSLRVWTQKSVSGRVMGMIEPDGLSGETCLGGWFHQLAQDLQERFFVSTVSWHKICKEDKKLYMVALVAWFLSHQIIKGIKA